MVKVLEPFEVRAGDTATIDENVWGADNASAGENLLGGVSCWSIGTFEDSLDLNELSIASVERLLSGSRNHAICGLEKELLRILRDSFSGVWEASESSVFDHVVLNSLYIKASWVVDSRVILNDSCDLSSVLFNKFRGPVADSTESLNNEGLTVNTTGKTDSVCKALGVEKLTDGIVDTETGRFGSTFDTTL